MTLGYRNIGPTGSQRNFPSAVHRAINGRRNPTEVRTGNAAHCGRFGLRLLLATLSDLVLVALTGRASEADLTMVGMGRQEMPQRLRESEKAQ